MSSLFPDDDDPRPARATGGSPRRDALWSSSKEGRGLKYVVTIAVAATADSLQITFPPLWIPISIMTAIILFSLWGWRWEILAVLVPELAPVVGVLPTWVAVALYLTGRDLKSADKPGLAKENDVRRVGPHHSTEDDPKSD